MKLRKKTTIIEANQCTEDGPKPPGCEVGVGYCKYHVFVDGRAVVVFNTEWVCTENGTDYFILTDAYIKEHFEEVE